MLRKTGTGFNVIKRQKTVLICVHVFINNCIFFAGVHSEGIRTGCKFLFYELLALNDN